ncbi:MAG: putative zinc-binding protein [Desulfobulbaceae bacterium]|nr:putative zinc-binding protein [Desulfobulbaceae bacterium]
MKTNDAFTLKVTSIDKVCEAGEVFGRQCQKKGKIPVFSCEGGCIKGEIARQAANLVAKDEGFSRACHGELFTVPQADLAKWVREAGKVVVIDGCSLFCHGRIAENIIGKDQLVLFDALSIHRKYAHLMNVDDVPEEERKQAAREVADKVLANLKEGIPGCPEPLPTFECGSSSQAASGCTA